MNAFFSSARGTRQAEVKAPTIGFTAIASRTAVCSWAVGCPNVGLQLSTPAMRCASKSLHATEPFQMVPLGKFRVSNVEKTHLTPSQQTTAG